MVGARSGIHVFGSRLEAVQGMGRRLILHIREITRHRICRIALAGGDEYEFFYKYLANSRLSDILWSRLEIFFSEEYCEPLDGRRSLQQLAMDSLLEGVDIEDEMIHEMGGAADVESAGQAYASRIGSKPLDIVLVNSHSDCLSPPANDSSPAPPSLQTRVDQEGHKLWCLSPAVVNRASLVLVLATGEDSAGMMANLLRRDGSTEPERGLNQTAGELHWFLDNEAASRLLPRR